MKKWTMVIPIYNDSKSLGLLLIEIDKYKFDQGHFLVVDNGSTVELMTELDSSAIPEEVEIIRTDRNLGFGGGIMFGLSATRTEWVGWMPGNLKVHPSQLLFFEPLIESDKFDLIKAKRKGRSFQANLKTLVASFIQSLVMRQRMSDTGGTPTFLRRIFLAHLQDAPSDYVFESFVMFKARSFNLKINRPNVLYGNRQFGNSHWQRGLGAEFSLMKNIVRQSKTWR
jgi:glycosyltransferase involved in cell wall biosynthesis